MADRDKISGDTLAEIADTFDKTIEAIERSYVQAAWDHPLHGPHTLLSHDDKRYAGCRHDECYPLYRKGAF